MAEDKPPAASLEQAVEVDSDPDFDDLDDVLDQFSANAPSSQPPASKSEPTTSKSEPTTSKSEPTTSKSEPTTSKSETSASGPGRPDISIPSGQGANESEDEFIKRLTAEMSSVMSNMELPKDSQATPDDLAKMGKDLEEFTQKMEAEGIKPEDLLKAILGEDTGTRVGDAAHEERERRESQSQSKSPEPPASSSKATFEDTIRKTIERMEDSSAKATSDVQEKSEEDMLADMLKALEGGGNEGDLSKVFLGMMEQLTSKDLLYEPMLELHQKFPDWLSQNKSKIKQEDYARYARQKEIVKDIVGKFEEEGYSDDDPKCREYVWEKMQKMQEQGAPPEDLIQNPIPGLGGDGPPEEGCPTQ